MDFRPGMCVNDVGIRKTQIGYKTNEIASTEELPKVDVLRDIRRGQIDTDLYYRTFNNGCVSYWGCVSNSGYNCRVKEKPHLDVLYNENLVSNLEPPEWLQGIKSKTFSSVNGWIKDDSGKYQWQIKR